MDNTQKLEDLKKRFTFISNKFDKSVKQKELSQLDLKSRKADFWKDSTKAQKIMKSISEINKELELFNSIESEINNLSEMNLLSSSDQKFNINIQNKMEKLETTIEYFEKKMFLSAEYDENEAIISIHAGQGGVEAMDWVDMLSRMYQKYFSKQKWDFEVINEDPGEEAGFKSVSIIVRQRYAFGLLKNEAGVHRLVRQSPFNAASLRQTSFALVEVMPEIDQTPDIEIKPDDLEFEAFRASGHGGQNVNKV